MRYAIRRRDTGAVALRLCSINLWLIALIVVVFININVACGRLVMLRTRGLIFRRRCLGHTGERCLRLCLGRDIDGCQGWRMMSSL